METNNLGVVVTEVDVLLPDGDDVVRPDCSFIFHKNMKFVKKHIHGHPAAFLSLENSMQLGFFPRERNEFSRMDKGMNISLS